MPPKLFILTFSQSNGLRIGPFLAPLLQAAYPGCVLLNKAVGGSSILSWQQGQPNYDAALNDVFRLMPDYEPYRIISIIGETDAKKLQTASTFKSLFWDGAGDFRADIGYPYLPVIYVQLGPKPALVNGVDLYPAWNNVQDAQELLTVNHTAYRKVIGVGGYNPGAPYCHRTDAANQQQAALIMDAL